MSAAPDFQAWVKDVQAAAESDLDRFLPPASQAPTKLHEAMRYTALGGGMDNGNAPDDQVATR